MSFNNGGSYPPSFRVAKLYRKQAKTGGTYFTGRWGGAKVALVKTKDVGDQGEEIWALLFSESPQPKPDDKPAAATQPNTNPPRPYRERTLDDDSIPF